ncbi:MAG TPA: AI-2E family transporter, partial [Longimicrobiaceae bacterium]|nr:AI-2E family transporter [Longimicrobiaceae bacterium]
QAPSLVTLMVGGGALALLLSFPVRALSHVVPQKVAILVSLLLLAGLLVLAVAVLVPVLAEQLGALVVALPAIAVRIDARLPSLLAPLAERGLLPGTPEEFVTNLERQLLEFVQALGGRILSGLGGVVASAFGTAVTIFGMIFIAVYLVADARTLRARFLRAAPRRYRRDARELWNAFGFTLSRYLGGLGLSLAIQGVFSALALGLLGVPYPLLLGAWVSVTALLPYVGAWIGAVPAVLLALSVSSTTALLTAILFLVIQQLEGNVLTPRIQSQAVRVHPILVFLAVIAGGEMAGIPGVIFAVPALAVARVLWDFFGARVRTGDAAWEARQGRGTLVIGTSRGAAETGADVRPL